MCDVHLSRDGLRQRLTHQATDKIRDGVDDASKIGSPTDGSDVRRATPKSPPSACSAASTDAAAAPRTDNEESVACAGVATRGVRPVLKKSFSHPSNDKRQKVRFRAASPDGARNSSDSDDLPQRMQPRSYSTTSFSPTSINRNNAPINRNMFDRPTPGAQQRRREPTPGVPLSGTRIVERVSSFNYAVTRLMRHPVILVGAFLIGVFWFYTQYALLATITEKLSVVIPVGIVDGDTFRVRLPDGTNVFTVKLLGVEAPEPTQYHHRDSTMCLTNILSKGNVSIFVYHQDTEGRMVADAWIAPWGDPNNATIIQRMLLVDGCVWHLEQSDGRQVFTEWMHSAKQNRTGLWASDDKQVPPWHFRVQQERAQRRKTGAAASPNPKQPTRVQRKHEPFRRAKAW